MIFRLTRPYRSFCSSQESSSQSKSLLVKIPLFRSNETGAQLTPTKTTANRTYSPVKMNGFLSNNYCQSKQAAANSLTNLHLSRLPSSETWMVGQSPLKCKTSSIASGLLAKQDHTHRAWKARAVPIRPSTTARMPVPNFGPN